MLLVNLLKELFKVTFGFFAGAITNIIMEAVGLGE